MTLTKVTDYDPVLLLSYVQPLSFTIAVETIIEGSSTGVVWMDEPSHPTLVVLWDHKDGVYIVSLENSQRHMEDLRALFKKEIIPEAEKHNEAPVFVIYTFPEYDENGIGALFSPDWNVTRKTASFYHLPLVGYSSEQDGNQLPLMLEGNFIDLEVLTDSTIPNICILLEEIESNWESIDNFLTGSFGYYVKDLENNSLVSWIVVEKIARSCAEFAIETDEYYRCKGLGEFATREMIKHSLKLGLTPHWYCLRDNIASKKLAEKVGFQKMQDYEVFWVERR